MTDDHQPDGPEPIAVVLDLGTNIKCTVNSSGKPTLIIDTSDTRVTITVPAPSLPHTPAAADLAEAAQLFYEYTYEAAGGRSRRRRLRAI